MAGFEGRLWRFLAGSACRNEQVPFWSWLTRRNNEITAVSTYSSDNGTVESEYESEGRDEFKLILKGPAAGGHILTQVETSLRRCPLT